MVMPSLNGSADEFYQIPLNIQAEGPIIRIENKTYEVLSLSKPQPVSKVWIACEKVGKFSDIIFSISGRLGVSFSLYGIYKLFESLPPPVLKGLGEGGDYILIGLQVASYGIGISGAVKLIKFPVVCSPENTIYQLREIGETNEV